MGGLEARLARRCFDHLHAELSVEIGKLVPRYPLWIRVREAGYDPDAFGAGQLVSFFDEHLDPFLLEEGLVLPPRRRARLRKRITRFDPDVPTPYETIERIFGSPR